MIKVSAISPPLPQLALAGLLLVLGQAQAQAQTAAAPSPKAQDVDVIERLNEQVPLDATFTDSEGKVVKLADYLGGDRPVLLSLVYYRCPMLCSLVLGGLNKAVLGSGLKLGQDYTAVTVSIDPDETPEQSKERQRGYLQSLNAPGQQAHWPFLTGEQEQIDRLAQSVGFKYYFDESTGQYAHGAVVMVLTPEGRVSRYLYGVDFPARDVRFAVMEAAEGKVGTSFDRIILRCFRYDPNTRRYGLYVFGFIRGGALVVFVALAAALALFWRREYKRGSIR